MTIVVGTAGALCDSAGMGSGGGDVNCSEEVSKSSSECHTGHDWRALSSPMKQNSIASMGGIPPR